MARARPIAAAEAAPAALPADVRTMQRITSAVFVLAILLVLAAALAWFTRRPYFDIDRISVEGDLQRNNATTLRANVASRLAGNFFSLDLQQARAAFETVPWVRHAVVRRLWPDRLVVRLEEQHPAALWEGDDDGEDRLVNVQGEVFEANVGDVEDEELPTLAGPAGSSAQVLRMFHSLGPVVKPMGTTIESLRLSARGSWKAELDSGAEIEIGRGDDAEVIARVERFVRTVSQVTGKFERPLQYADLRHPDAYALRLKGVTTTLAATPAPAKPAARPAARPAAKPNIH